MPTRIDPRARFWVRVAKTDTCWLWTGAKAGGYGYVKRDGRTIPAHRYAYTIAVGQIPAGLVIDHLCRNPQCVNPAHLEPVTNRENILRGAGAKIAAYHANRCLRGHSMHDAYRYGGRRQCRTCVLENRRRRAQLRVARERKA